jgi:GDP-4-dehydro-6-deoxy-D-mannose reductase
VRAFVTGSAGFVGRHLSPRLEAAGYEVVGRDRELDVTDAARIEAELARVEPDVVLHLAAQSSVAMALKTETLTYHVNFIGARNVLEAVARRAPGARVLLVSSGDVYGLAQPESPPFTEAAPLRPRSAYARGNACADLLGATHARRGLDVVRVRPFSHTGPGQSETFVAPSFARQAVEIATGRRAASLMVGNLDSVRDFLDVEDVVDAYLRLLDRNVPAGVYNVASGVGRRVGELLEGLLSRAEITPQIEVDADRHRPADHAVGDATKLRRATGWEPRVPFEHTLDRVIGDWRLRSTAA